MKQASADDLELAKHFADAVDEVTTNRDLTEQPKGSIVERNIEYIIRQTRRDEHKGSQPPVSVRANTRRAGALGWGSGPYDHDYSYPSRRQVVESDEWRRSKDCGFQGNNC
jgi:hypothetical protein